MLLETEAVVCVFELKQGKQSTTQMLEAGNAQMLKQKLQHSRLQSPT